MIPNGLYWNQAELEPASGANQGLVSIFAFGDDQRPIPVGTGFITAAFGNRAVGCTAAHNFAGVQRFQKLAAPKPHPTALSEFLPKGAPLDLDRTKLRAMCWEDGKIEFAYFDWAIWDERADLAFFGIHVQDGSDPNFFRSNMLLDHALPEVGDAEVAVLGYNDMKVLSFDPEQNEGTISRQLLLRTGRVTSYHPEGYALIRSACVETTIPIFPGMSGAPVMKFEEGKPILPFGVMSFDADTETKWDRSFPGHSFVALIRPVIEFSNTGQRSTMLKLDSGIMAGAQWMDDEHRESEL